MHGLDVVADKACDAVEDARKFTVAASGGGVSAEGKTIFVGGGDGGSNEKKVGSSMKS